MHSYSSQPSWIMFTTMKGSDIWVNLRNVSFIQDNGDGTVRVISGDQSFVTEISFEKIVSLIGGQP